MTDVPEEKKNNVKTPKLKKQVKWNEDELRQSKQQHKKAPETLIYRPKQQIATKTSAAPKSETHERKEKEMQQVVHEKPAHNNERQPRQQKLQGQRTQSTTSSRNMQSYG